MRRTRTLALVPALLATALGSPALPRPASAEGFVDLYLGAAFPENDSLHFATSVPGVGLPSQRHADFDASPSFGVRGGYWFPDPVPFLGLGLDLSYYRAFEDRGRAPFDFFVLPMTPLLMLRVPIARSERFPGGRFQPYAAVGPGLNVTLAYGDLSELNTGLDDFGDASFDVGLDARGGIAFQLSRRIALFTEYRYTYLEPSFDDEVDAYGPNVDIDVSAKLETHHVVFGVSFRF